MSNQSPIIYLSLGKDGNISIATHTPAKYAPTAVHEAIHKGEVSGVTQWVDLPPANDEEAEIGGCLFPNWVREEIVKAATVDRVKE